MGEHDGHRERLRSKYLRSGGGDMTDAELLELALFYSVPRRDVRPLAESLLARFGSLSGVFDASAGELCEIAGVGEHSALLLGVLGSLRDLVRRVLADPQSTPGVREILLTNLRGIDRDVFLVLYLDRTGAVFARKTLSVSEPPDISGLCRVIANQAGLTGCPYVILARGLARAETVPDREISLVSALRRGLKTVGVDLSDFVVVTPTEYVSMAGRFPFGGTRFRPRPDGNWG